MTNISSKSSQPDFLHPIPLVFWGTTNAEVYLKDETGGRRFWPIKVGKIEIGDIVRDRDQLWAEADALYKAGARWWITEASIQMDAERQQRDRYVGDPWERAIEDYVVQEGPLGVSIEGVLRFAVQLDIKDLGQVEQNRAARCLKSLGLVRYQARIGEKRIWKYRRPVTSPVTNPAPDPAPDPARNEPPEAKVSLYPFPGDTPCHQSKDPVSPVTGDTKSATAAGSSPLSPLSPLSLGLHPMCETRNW
jgi:hypothetical protein